MQFTVADKHLIKWLWLSKHYKQCQKCLLKVVFLQKMKWVKATDRKTSAKSLTLVIFLQLCAWVDVLWCTITQSQANDATAVIFSKCFQSAKTLLCARQHLFIESTSYTSLYTSLFTKMVGHKKKIQTYKQTNSSQSVRPTVLTKCIDRIFVLINTFLHLSLTEAVDNENNSDIWA